MTFASSLYLIIDRSLIFTISVICLLFFLLLLLLAKRSTWISHYFHLIGVILSILSLLNSLFSLLEFSTNFNNFFYFNIYIILLVLICYYSYSLSQCTLLNIHSNFRRIVLFKYLFLFIIILAAVTTNCFLILIFFKPSFESLYSAMAHLTISISSFIILIIIYYMISIIFNLVLDYINELNSKSEGTVFSPTLHNEETILYSLTGYKTTPLYYGILERVNNLSSNNYYLKLFRYLFCGIFLVYILGVFFIFLSELSDDFSNLDYIILFESILFVRMGALIFILYGSYIPINDWAFFGRFSISDSREEFVLFEDEDRTNDSRNALKSDPIVIPYNNNLSFLKNSLSPFNRSSKNTHLYLSLESDGIADSPIVGFSNPIKK